MSTTTIDLRGRDLIITPPENVLSLPTPELLDSLFGAHLPNTALLVSIRSALQANWQKPLFGVNARERSLLAGLS